MDAGSVVGHVSVFAGDVDVNGVAAGIISANQNRGGRIGNINNLEAGSAFNHVSVFAGNVDVIGGAAGAKFFNQSWRDRIGDVNNLQTFVSISHISVFAGDVDAIGIAAGVIGSGQGGGSGTINKQGAVRQMKFLSRSGGSYPNISG